MSKTIKNAAPETDMVKQKRAQLEGKINVGEDRELAAKLGVGFWDSVPYFPITRTYYTAHVHHAIKRFRRAFAINAYLAEVYPAVECWSSWQDIVRCVGTIFDRAFEGVDRNFTEAEGQTMQLMLALGLTDENAPQYLNPMHFEYAITTPRVKQYLDLLERLDVLVKRLDMLWLADGGIDAQYARHESIRLRQTLLKVSATVYRQSDRIRSVLKKRLTIPQMIDELEEELEKHYGLGMKETNDDGDNMLLEGEKEVTGALVGEATASA